MHLVFSGYSSPFKELLRSFAILAVHCLQISVPIVVLLILVGIHEASVLLLRREAESAYGVPY